MKTFIRFHVTFLAVLSGCMTMFAAPTVPEPSTVIYGTVLHRVNGNEHRLTEGVLQWTLKDQNGTPYVYTAQLEDIKGVFSYRISIPHQAIAMGLSVDSSAIPLGVGEKTYQFDSIQVNGSPAEVIWSERDSLKLMQSSRAATHRIDLQVSYPLADQDGDGMPDWWEKLYGLDWQRPDGNLDTDGDGLNHLAEYRGGTDPTHDDRAPTLKTSNLAAYGESSNGVWLKTIDVDTAPEALRFTLTALPDGGSLCLNGGSQGAVTLGVGDVFTQDQVNRGLLVFRHAETNVDKTAFSVSLSDGVHDAFVADVDVAVFPPKTASAPSASVKASPAWWRDENAVFESYWGLRENVYGGDLVESALLYLMGKNYGWSVWDERTLTLPVTLSVSGPGSHIVMGGDGDDVISGSGQDDIIAGGPGVDTLKGGGGLDLFIVADLGTEIIQDFDEQKDVLDLSGMLVGRTGLLNSFLRASFDGADTEIRLDQNGDGSGFTDAVIRLVGLELDQDDLHRLWSKGQLLLGSVQGLSTVSIDGPATLSLEEGYTTASLTFRRNGPTNAPLLVSLAISGTATNGVDYSTLPAVVSFGAGKSTATLTVVPLLDALSEYVEQINLGIATGGNYVVGSGSSVQIGIVDAKQRFNIYPVQSMAVVGEDPAYFQILRQGPKSGVVQLILTVSGTGVKNVDYSAVPTLVTFADNQGSLYLPVEALGNGALSGGEKSRTLTVSIRPSLGDEYALGASPSATVRLVSSRKYFEQWLTQSIPGVSPTLSTAEMVRIGSPRTGLSALLEYASSYGLKLDDGIDSAERALMTPQLRREANGMYFEFSKRLDDDRLEYVVERSSDMIQWESGAGLFEPNSASPAQQDAGRVRYRVLEPAGAPLPFMRVRVTLKD